MLAIVAIAILGENPILGENVLEVDAVLGENALEAEKAVLFSSSSRVTACRCI